MRLGVFDRRSNGVEAQVRVFERLLIDDNVDPPEFSELRRSVDDHD